MSYYFFNRCRENCLPKIEKLADELGLEKIERELPARQWEGYPFKRKKKFDRNLLMIYNPQRKYPLIVQTASEVSHKQQDVKKFMQKLIQICNPTQIDNLYDFTYDMKEFR